MRRDEVMVGFMVSSFRYKIKNELQICSIDIVNSTMDSDYKV